MEIFQKSVIEKYLQSLDETKVNTAFQKFQKFYGNKARIQNIQQLKEENYQEGFLREIFVQVLGYTINPDEHYNLTTEFKNLTDAKKADGAILKDGSAIGVIELKSTKTINLETIKHQAFNYKNNQPDCKYVITSNFRLLRFYIENATEFEEFDLFNLNKTDFRKLYLILSKESMFNDVPAKLKQETKFHEENISDKFYKDYSTFKHKIFNNLVKNNPQYDKLIQFKKSQKLLDRLLFIFFAEDRGLVPPNAISRIIDQWSQLQDLEAYQPLYDRFKLFFDHLDKGHKYNSYELPNYNGGLFAKDEILNSVIIEDDILEKDSIKLSAYDFSTEIDVNILGHIFEHSLNEIEEITSELEGKPVDKKKTKRKKEGIYYTPKYITQYIVENTIGALCKEKKQELDISEITIDDSHRKADGKISKKGEQLFQKLDQYKEWLLTLKILDPACGSGAFLNQALDFLIEEHKINDMLINELTQQPLGLYDTDKQILENNLFGVDINEESVEIAKLSLWLRTAKIGRKLSMLNNNIKCGNSLIDDPEIAGEKAFNWEKEFPEIFAKGGFDVVIGNPPYVRVQFLPYQEIDFYKENKKTAYKRIDISTLFIEEAFKLLKNEGKLSFITSNQFQTTEYGQETRRFISQKYCIDKILDFGDLPVFEGALTYVSIYSLSKKSPKDFLYKRIHRITEAQRGNYANFTEIPVASINESKWSLVSKTELDLLRRVEKYETLSNVGNAWAGLFTGMDNLLMFTFDEMEKSGIERKLFLPVIRASDPVRNGLALPSKFVIYPYKEEGEKTVVYSEEELKNNFPKGYEYLLSNKELLQSRQDSRKTFKERKDWYALTRFGTKKVFKQTKIVSPGEVKEHKFSLDKSGSGFSCARVFAITVKENYPIKGLLAILNSSLIRFYLQRKSSLKSGGYFTYSSKVLNDVPLPKKISEKLISKTDNLLQLNSDFNKNNKTLLELIQNKYNNNLSKKLNEWFSLEVKEFLQELKKSKINLSLSQESEWMNYFKEQKQKAIELKAEIDKTDKEIDQMVYELYGLTTEEIEIVESSFKTVDK